MVTDVNGCGWVVGRALLHFSLKLQNKTSCDLNSSLKEFESKCKFCFLCPPQPLTARCFCVKLYRDGSFLFFFVFFKLHIVSA